MIHVIRIIFLMLVAAVASTYLMQTATESLTPWFFMIGGVVVALTIITVDLLTPKKNLTALSGLFFGVLVGLVVSFGLNYLIDQVLNVLVPDVARAASLSGTDVPIFASEETRELQEKAALYRPLIEGFKLLLSLIVTYVTVSFILQTKDDFRFIIPYVEFARATRGPRPLVLDTSVIIDGRIADLAGTGVFETRMLLPRFVLTELQTIADSSDRLKRSRGRRGLDVLQRLQSNGKIDLHIWDGTLANQPEGEGVDQKLVALALQEHGRIVTNDFNLNKVAQLRGVEVINLNQIAEALKPVVLPGESMTVRIVKPGESAGQGVGYLEDGTMVVVESARERVGQEVQIVVTNALQTAAGKMIFGRVDAAGVGAGRSGR